MPSPPTDANPTISYGLRVPGYDAAGNQVGIAIRALNLVTDPDTNITYGDLSIAGAVSLSGSLSLASEYPAGATPVMATSGVKSNAVATATLPGASGVTTYLKGFDVTGSGATVGLPVTVTVSNLAAALVWIYCATAGALLANTPLIVRFDEGIPATALNTTIAVSCPALGVGNVNNVVNAYGYQL